MELRLAARRQSGGLGETLYLIPAGIGQRLPMHRHDAVFRREIHVVEGGVCNREKPRAFRHIQPYRGEARDNQQKKNKSNVKNGD